MKKLLILCFILLSFYAFAQNKEAPSIKIYLEDAETGKNISDAKVTLEGFEIPALTAKYDKKAKAYYFDEIPKGYNTVMAYHKKYNEKGFQDMKGLPSELKLKLYDPLNVSYSFHSEPYKDSRQTIYVEDPYKIGILSKDMEDYNLFKDYLYKELEKLNLDIEVVNPYWEIFKTKIKPYCFSLKNVLEGQKEAYPYVQSLNAYNFGIDLPLDGASSTLENATRDNGRRRITAKNIVFYVRKKDGTKFKRYNDPFLEKIRTIKGANTVSVIYRKYGFKAEKGRMHYKNRYTKKLDKIRDIKKKVDPSKVFFYTMCSRSNDWCYGRSERMIRYQALILPEKKFAKDDYKEHLSDCKKEIFEFDQGIGLGILDQCEKISDCLKLDADPIYMYSPAEVLK